MLHDIHNCKSYCVQNMLLAFAIAKIFLYNLYMPNGMSHLVSMGKCLVPLYSPWARRGHHAPPKDPREWYNIVHWTPLIKNQNVNPQIFWVLLAILDGFLDGRPEKRQMPI